jgi:hypothetical protein
MGCHSMNVFVTSLMAIHDLRTEIPIFGQYGRGWCGYRRRRFYIFVEWYQTIIPWKRRPYYPTVGGYFR